MTTAIHPASFVDDRAELGVGVVIGPGAVVGAHVRIGDRTRVDSHALVTGWTTIGKGCTLHHGAVAVACFQNGAINVDHLLRQMALVQVLHGGAPGRARTASQHTLQRGRNGLGLFIGAQLAPRDAPDPLCDIADRHRYHRQIARQRFLDGVG